MSKLPGFTMFAMLKTGPSSALPDASRWKMPMSPNWRPAFSAATTTSEPAHRLARPRRDEQRHDALDLAVGP